MKNYLYDGYLTTFVNRDLGKYLNMSFDEFICRPKYEIEAMIRVISGIQEKKNAATSKALSELENSKSKPPPNPFEE